jgi:acyl-coenzyme A thioesterase PaaI-like protein
MSQPAAPNLWGLDTGGARPGGDHYIELVQALRQLQDVVVCADPIPEAARAAMETIQAAQRLLEDDALVPGRHHAGLRADVPGRGHPFAVPVQIDEWSVDRVTGTATFSRFFLGGGVAVHGGATAVMFDELLGRLTNNGPATRTAYLKVDYRRVIPIDTPLACTAWVVRREGRKTFVRGEVSLHGNVLAEAEGLWVELDPDRSAAERGVLE